MDKRSYAQRLEDGFNYGLPDEDKIKPHYEKEIIDFDEVEPTYLLAEVHDWFLYNDSLSKNQWNKLIYTINNTK